MIPGSSAVERIPVKNKVAGSNPARGAQLMDKKITLYLQKIKDPQKEICIKLREIILRNFPKLKETVMSEGLWYEGKFYLTAFKDHVNLGVGVGGLNHEELKHFEGKGKSMRHLKFYSIKDINEEYLIKLMRIVYERTDCNCKINWKS